MLTAVFVIFGLALVFGIGGMYIILKLHSMGLLKSPIAGVKKIKKVAGQRREKVSARKTAKTFKAVIYKSGTPNGRGVTYPHEELIKAVKEFNSKDRFGYMGSEYALVSAENATHTVRLSMDGDTVVSYVKPLTTTSAGLVLLKELRDGRDYSAFPIIIGSVLSDKQVYIDKIFSVNVVLSMSVDMGATRANYKLKAVS